MFVPTAAAPRAADWDACLWQVQLVTFGAATIGGPRVPEWRWGVEAELPEPALRFISLSVSSFTPSLAAARMSADRNSLQVGHSVSRGDAGSQQSGSKFSARNGAVGEMAGVLYAIVVAYII